MQQRQPQAPDSAAQEELKLTHNFCPDCAGKLLADMDEPASVQQMG